jgi:2-amino-4-hydroxy-6-hydroxymethyldihydropteridine diphosphokinase
MVGYVALGSNLGGREDHLRAGIVAIAAGGMTVAAVSSIWETEPVDGAGPAWFLNMVIRVDTELAPERALEVLLAAEASRGRTRTRPNAPRELDCDLLLLGDIRRATPELTLPHPRLWLRGFVLAPLGELAPDLRNPATGRTVAESWAALADPHAVRRIGPLALPETLPVYSRAL